MDDKPAMPVGEAIKATQNGELPVGTVEQILEAAPKDLVEETVSIPEWGLSVVCRSYTAAKGARIKSRGLLQNEQGLEVAWAEMEIAQFQEGVVTPKFTEEQVRQLHMTSGIGFQRIINWLDEKSGTNKEELAKARDEFHSEGQ